MLVCRYPFGNRSLTQSFSHLTVSFQQLCMIVPENRALLPKAYQQTSVTKAKMARSLSPPSGKGECHENSSLSFRCSDSRFFDAAGDGFLVIPSFYPKVVNDPGPGTIESYGVIGGAI